MYKVSIIIIRLWQTIGLRCFEKYPSIKIILGSLPIEDLRQAVETARILTKEKIDKQLVGQSSSTPFMNIQDGYTSGKKVVTFDTQDR